MRKVRKLCPKSSASYADANICGHDGVWLVTVMDRDQFSFEPTTIEVVPTAGAKLTERFRPVMSIARGGMGEIHLVEERNSGRYVEIARRASLK